MRQDRKTGYASRKDLALSINARKLNALQLVCFKELAKLLPSLSWRTYHSSCHNLELEA